jgi:hypothetical protein
MKLKETKGAFPIRAVGVPEIINPIANTNSRSAGRAISIHASFYKAALVATGKSHMSAIQFQASSTRILTFPIQLIYVSEFI